MTFSPALSLYRGAVGAMGGVMPFWLNARARAGKEDPDRLQERYGRSTRLRPTGQLVWIHAASVGEAGVALQIAEAMEKRDPWLSFLISTGTRTSAEMVAKRAGLRTRHVYAPIDRQDAVKRFLGYWKPDLGVFVESEVWPNLILEAQARKIPLALVNARMSPKTLERWRRWRSAGKRLFSAFDSVTAADKRTADALLALRGEPAPVFGNLKLAASPPQFESLPRAAFEAQIGARKMWLAASTHEGEEDVLMLTHARLREEHPDALLIIVPRHPDRGAAIAALFGGAPQRSLDQPIGDAAVYVADTLGELGLFYALAPAAFIGGSLKPHLKGHNPIEPAKLGAPVISGPFVESFEDIFDALIDAGAAMRAGEPEDIAAAVNELWADPELRKQRADAAKAVVVRGGAALNSTIAHLCALLPPAPVQAKTADAPA